MGQFTANGFSSIGAHIAYNVGVRAVCEFIVGPTDSPTITEISVGVQVNSSVSLAFLLGVSSSLGVSPQYIGPPIQAYDPNNAVGGLSLATSWAVPPGNPAKWLRRVSLTVNGGQSVPPFVFKFPRGLKLAPSSSLILYNNTAAAGHTVLADVWVEYDN